ncbi:MAG TPA: hypothetical protein VL961_04170 [Acidimicrobiales bacterium]|nr:hypothetical protein [Acidimicrobiales bacterium]
MLDLVTPPEPAPPPVGAPRTRTTTDAPDLRAEDRRCRLLLAAGLAAVAAGVLLITVGWVRVASVDLLALQLPYVVSCGLAGFGLVVTGVGFVHIGARRKDGLAQLAQLERTRWALARRPDHGGGGS